MRADAAKDSDIACKECGQPMTLIQQPNADGGYIPLITCWHKTCLLYGVTLSVNQYNRLTEADLEAYREMNRVSRAKYIKSDGNQK